MVVAKTSSATGAIWSANSACTAPISVVWVRTPLRSISTMGKALEIRNRISAVTTSGSRRR
ncbi:hypothetical protein D3C87_1777120 [compost metagenome]